MNRPGPIPTATLKDILARRKDDPEVLALLWEIWRYRIVARKAYNLAKSVTRFDSTRGLLIDGLLGELEGDPAILEMLGMQEEMLADHKNQGPERKKRD